MMHIPLYLHPCCPHFTQSSAVELFHGWNCCPVFFVIPQQWRVVLLSLSPQPTQSVSFQMQSVHNVKRHFEVTDLLYADVARQPACHLSEHDPSGDAWVHTQPAMKHFLQRHF